MATPMLNGWVRGAGRAGTGLDRPRRLSDTKPPGIGPQAKGHPPCCVQASGPREVPPPGGLVRGGLPAQAPGDWSAGRGALAPVTFLGEGVPLRAVPCQRLWGDQRVLVAAIGGGTVSRCHATFIVLEPGRVRGGSRGGAGGGRWPSFPGVADGTALAHSPGQSRRLT